ncbi:hypothetical protein [Aquimarina sp. 2201CG5-10]|uniref:hypothetical protein n=1 Tax=Aquimarina callyspongiae TaxID=3098150 RepID=UPI002AB448D9|nr:hypothetical protein [Aquimarina sp. 2201CG5-10]MDY8136457.1 hypothetical protein [Aquimarina sp. 2201CG5-10]
MRFPIQSKPILKNNQYHKINTGITPSDCPNGNAVWDCDGRTATTVISCCYNFPSGCNPCSDPKPPQPGCILKSTHCSIFG